MPWSRSVLILVSLLVVGLLAAACGDDDEGGDYEFIYITPNEIGSNPFLQLGQDGTQRAAENLGGIATTYESSDESSRRANVEAAVEEAPDVIVLTSFQLAELADEFSKANPDQEFVLIDDCPPDPAPNLHCGQFKEQEGAYLVGIMAGHLTQTKHVGSVAAQDSPFFYRWTDNFAAGASFVDSEIENITQFIGGDNPFSDPARAKEVALSLAAQGVDQIFAVGAGSNGGIFEAAQEVGFMTYGVDVNECEKAPEHIVDNNLKHVDVVTELLIEQVLNGEAGSRNEYGLAEGGVEVVALQEDVSDSGCLIANYPELIEEVRDVADEIIAGTITPADPLTGG